MMNQNDQLLLVSERLAKRINYPENQERRKQLVEKFLILFKNGFNENLFLQMDPKFFVEKGFSICEALLITKSDQSFHPTIEEIQRLTKDNFTNLLKLEYIPPKIKNKLNHFYILVIGPKNKGKTTVIFNIINSLYNIKADSLYRVKKGQSQINCYYDEYIIQINENECYVFVDFKGIGDVKLDFLGLDLSGKNNLFKAIVKYAQNKSILSILYVNSSSVNRFALEERYYQQRFFEILPKSFLNKIIFILTYCTDNQPILEVYTTPNNTIIPEQMKALMKQNPESMPKEGKFWFELNNAFLYKKMDYGKKESEDSNDIQAVIDGQKYLNVQIQSEEGNEIGINIQDYSDKDNQKIETFQEVYEKTCTIQMFQASKAILERIFFLRSILSNQRGEEQNFKNLLEFEQGIFKLLQISRKLSILNFPNQIIKERKKSNYIQYIIFHTKKEIKSLFCFICQRTCHITCQLQNFSQIFKNELTCPKLIDNRVKPYKDITIQLREIQCKKCLKRSYSCTLEAHALIESGFIEQKQFAIVGQIVANNFHEEYMEQQKYKNILRLQQTANFNLRCAQMQQKDIILKNQQQLNAQNDRLTKIDLNIRLVLLNEINNRIIQDFGEVDKDYFSRLSEIKEVYNKICCSQGYQTFQDLKRFQMLQQKNKQQSTVVNSEIVELQSESSAIAIVKGPDNQEELVAKKYNEHQQFSQLPDQQQYQDNGSQFFVTFGQQQFDDFLQKDQK